MSTTTSKTSHSYFSLSLTDTAPALDYNKASPDQHAKATHPGMNEQTIRRFLLRPNRSNYQSLNQAISRRQDQWSTSRSNLEQRVINQGPEVRFVTAPSTHSLSDKAHIEVTMPRLSGV